MTKTSVHIFELNVHLFCTKITKCTYFCFRAKVLSLERDDAYSIKKKLHDKKKLNI